MSKKANPTAIGVFVVGAISLVVAAVVLLGTGTLFARKASVVAVFRGAANGLDLGADVKFSGVRIGIVKRITLQIDPNTGEAVVPVLMEIYQADVENAFGDTFDLNDREAFKSRLERGLRARLRTQSFLTGKLFVELGIFPGVEGYSIPTKFHPTVNHIPTLPGEFDQIVESIANSLDDISSMDLSSVTGDLRALIADLRSRLEDLRLREMSNSIIQLTEDARKVVGNEAWTDSAAKLNSTLTSLEEASAQINKQIGILGPSLEETLAQSRSTLGEVEKAAGNLTRLSDPEARLSTQFSSAMRELSDAARALRELADYLERNPNAVISGRERDR